MRKFTGQLAILKKFGSVLSRISANLLRAILCVVLLLPMVSVSALAFDIYIPEKKEFKLTNKGGSNSYTETKTWLEQDHHIVLHFMDLFGIPEIPPGAMKEETAVLATNAALIGNDINLYNIYKGENWGDRKELEPDADFGTIYYKRFAIMIINIKAIFDKVWIKNHYIRHVRYVVHMMVHGARVNLTEITKILS